MWITYDIDFIPATRRPPAVMRAVRPIWIDVQNGQAYPVFDALRGDGTDGQYTYPDEAPARRRARRTPGWPTVTACSCQAPVTSTRAACARTDVVRSTGAGRSAHLFRSEARVLRAGRRGLVGRGDDGHRPTTGASR